VTQSQSQQRFTCAGCGADMAFDPASGGLKCPYCGSKEAVPQDSSARPVQENLLDDYLHAGPERLAQLSQSAVQVTCSSCGATTTFEPSEVAGFCAFCGGKIVAQPVAADPLIAPEAVLPFKLPKKQAAHQIQSWLGSRWFAPSALKNMARQESIQGVYLPFWTYDSRTVSDYTGQRGEHYWETEYYTEQDDNGNTVQRSRQVQRTRWWPAQGQVARDFDDVTIPASKSVETMNLHELSPWDLENLAPYAPAYLSGFKAQRYQVELGDGFEQARGIMAGVIQGDVRSDIGGDEQIVDSVQTRHFDVTFKHILLPIWIAAYRFNEKVYQVVVNARTGEVQGERPYSLWKIAGLVLLVLALIALFVYFQGSGNHSPARGSE
jgi:DNA-directed RNA polymerase subunit RPC12/RpoP